MRLILVAAIGAATNAYAAEPAYPLRPVRIVVGFPAGGNTDIISRAMAQKLTERFGQTVIVENYGPRTAFWVGSNHGASVIKLEPLD